MLFWHGERVMKLMMTAKIGMSLTSLKINIKPCQEGCRQDLFATVGAPPASHAQGSHRVAR